MSRKSSQVLDLLVVEAPSDDIILERAETFLDKTTQYDSVDVYRDDALVGRVTPAWDR